MAGRIVAKEGGLVNEIYMRNKSYGSRGGIPAEESPMADKRVVAVRTPWIAHDGVLPGVGGFAVHRWICRHQGFAGGGCSAGMVEFVEIVRRTAGRHNTQEHEHRCQRQGKAGARSENAKKPSLGKDGFFVGI